MLPFIKGNASYRINVPRILGVNYRDGVTMVHDDQATDELNMWGKNGALTTRPSVKFENIDSFSLSGIDGFTVKPRVTDSIVIVNGKKYVLEYEIYSKTTQNYGEYDLQNVRLRLRSSASDTIELGTISSNDVYYTNMNCLPIVDNSNVYVYIFGEHSEDVRINDYSVWKIERNGNKYEAPKKITNEIYVPTILTNCVGSFSETLQRGQLPRNAQQLEGFNLLGDKYKIIFSTFDYTEQAYTASEDTKGKATWMQFVLPYTTNDIHDEGSNDYEIIAERTDKQGIIHTHKVRLPYGNEVTTETEKENEDFFLACKFDENGICRIWFTNGDENNEYVLETYDKLRNNLVVTAPTKTTRKDKEKVFKMTRAIWYGNTSLGLSGGNRLFLGANLNEEDKSLLVWSDLKNPLYFGENNYNYIGDKSQAITGFGRQGSSLVIFKENEIYSTQYSTNSITTEDVTEQKIIDTSANSAVFPMTMINSQIGCNCPDTIQLCRNRLVWADKNGKIYTLTAQNQYSERNVYEVGEMVYPEIAKCDLSSAYSADWEDHYLLFTEDKVFVMDYNSYGYTNIASYTKNDDANILIPWHVWQLPTKVSRVTNAESLTLTRVTQMSTYYWFIDNMSVGFDKNDYYCSDLPDVYIEAPIPCFVQTKLFDFNYPERYKTIKNVSISFNDNGGTPIMVESVSDTAEEDQTIITLLGTDSTANRVKGTNCKQIIPFTKFSTRYGVKISCEGYMAIESITITYKTLGGIQ